MVNICRYTKGGISLEYLLKADISEYRIIVEAIRQLNEEEERMIEEEKRKAKSKRYY